ncbi:MAG: OmpA family protein [Paracoccaceae bacterium]
MTRASKSVLFLAAASLLTATACTDPAMVSPDDPNKNTKQGALLGGLIGGVTGALVSDNKGKGAIIGAAVGAGAGALVGNNLDKQEAELRRDLGNSATITNTGDRLIVTMPQDILFDTDSASLRTTLRTDLRTVASSLNTYPGTTVQVLGHTDNTGDAAYNYDLSQRRAGAVSAELIAAGVSAGRIQAIGRGEDQPVASNLTTEGRAQNRRVDIVILPNG